jgi:hypothetical protein
MPNRKGKTRRSEVDIIEYQRMHKSMRVQLEKIAVLLDALNIRDAVIQDFLMDALNVLEDEDCSTLSRAADVFEDGMCILDDLGFIKDDVSIIEQKLRSPALDGVDVDSLATILAAWAGAEVPRV